MSCRGVGDYFSNVVSSPILSKVLGSCYLDVTYNLELSKLIQRKPECSSRSCWLVLQIWWLAVINLLNAANSTSCWRAILQPSWLHNIGHCTQRKKNPMHLKLLVGSDAICECDQKLNCPRTVTLPPLPFTLLQALERQKAVQEMTCCWMQWLKAGAAARAKGLRVQALTVMLLELFCLVWSKKSRTNDAVGTPCKKWGVSSF